MGGLVGGLHGRTAWEDCHEGLPSRTDYCLSEILSSSHYHDRQQSSQRMISSAPWELQRFSSCALQSTAPIASVGLLVSGSHLIAVVPDVCDMHMAISACAFPETT